MLGAEAVDDKRASTEIQGQPSPNKLPVSEGDHSGERYKVDKRGNVMNDCAV